MPHRKSLLFFFSFFFFNKSKFFNSKPKCKIMIIESICKLCVIRIGIRELIANWFLLEIQDFDMIWTT